MNPLSHGERGKKNRFEESGHCLRDRELAVTAVAGFLPHLSLPRLRGPPQQLQYVDSIMVEQGAFLFSSFLAPYNSSQQYVISQVRETPEFRSAGKLRSST